MVEDEKVESRMVLSGQRRDSSVTLASVAGMGPFLGMAFSRDEKRWIYGGVACSSRRSSSMDSKIGNGTVRGDPCTEVGWDGGWQPPTKVHRCQSFSTMTRTDERGKRSHP